MESRFSDTSGSSFASVSAHKPSSDEFYPPSKPSIGLIESIPELDDETIIKTPLDCGIIVEAGMESRYSNTSGSSFASVSAHETAKAPIDCRIEENRDQNSLENIKEPEPDYSDEEEEEKIEDKPYSESQRRGSEDVKKSKTPYHVSHQPWDEDVNKSKTGCSFKKICKYLLWIMTCLGIAVLISLATLTNNETTELTSLSNKVPEVSYFKEQKKDIDGIKNLLDILKVKILDNGNSKANTSKICVDNCTFSFDGNFQSCRTCFGFITCSNGILIHRDCAPFREGQLLVWDDIQKSCMFKSSTC